MRLNSISSTNFRETDFLRKYSILEEPKLKKGRVFNTPDDMKQMSDFNNKLAEVAKNYKQKAIKSFEKAKKLIIK